MAKRIATVDVATLEQQLQDEKKLEKEANKRAKTAAKEKELEAARAREFERAQKRVRSAEGVWYHTLAAPFIGSRSGQQFLESLSDKERVRAFRYLGHSKDSAAYLVLLQAPLSEFEARMDMMSVDQQQSINYIVNKQLKLKSGLTVWPGHPLYPADV